MSRSYKKNPIYTDGRTPTPKRNKRHANKRIRHNKIILPNGKAYKNFTDEQGNKVSMGYKKAYELYKSISDNDKASFLVHMRNIDHMKKL